MSRRRRRRRRRRCVRLFPRASSSAKQDKWCISLEIVPLQSLSSCNGIKEHFLCSPRFSGLTYLTQLYVFTHRKMPFRCDSTWVKERNHTIQAASDPPVQGRELEAVCRYSKTGKRQSAVWSHQQQWETYISLSALQQNQIGPNKHCCQRHSAKLL